MDLLLDSVREPRTRAELALRPGEAFLGGGTWLYSEPQPRLTGLVDLTAMGWRAWRVSGTTLSLSATCTLAELCRIPAEPDWLAHPLLAQCCHALLASAKVWNVATVGGNICASLPAGAMIALTAALDARAVLWSPDGTERAVPVAELVTGPGQNQLTAGEVLRSVDIPLAALRSRTAFRKIALSALGRSGSVVIGRRTAGELVLCLTAATTRPVLLRFDAPPAPADLREVLAAVDCWHDDVHGAPDWRAHVTGVLAAEVCDELAPAGAR